MAVIQNKQEAQVKFDLVKPKAVVLHNASGEKPSGVAWYIVL